eukprot:9142380-Pyramimonas_sp.AAC.1
MWNTTRTSSPARPDWISGRSCRMRATLSTYQTHYHNGAGNRVPTPYKIVNGRHNYGTKIYMTTDTTRGR